MTELVRDFLEPADFYKAVKEIGIDFYTGVPDSLLKGMFSVVWYDSHTHKTPYIVHEY